MATSGSYDFTLTRNKIIRAMLRKVNALAEGETPSAETMDDCAEALNVMVKAWMNKGINLWKYDDIVVFPDATKQVYSLGSTGDHAASTYVKTEMAAVAASGAFTITVDSATGISSGDNIGVVLDDGTIQWTTVNGAPAGAVITLTAALTDDVSVDAHVYAYTTKIQRPLRVIDARVKMSDSNEITVTPISRQEYFRIPNKSQAERINQVYYDPQLTNGQLYVWPLAANASELLLLNVQIPLQDFDGANDNADLPVEWLEALIYNGAVRIAPDFGFSLSDPSGNGPDIKEMAAITLEDALGFDREITSVRMAPAMDEGEDDD